MRFLALLAATIWFCGCGSHPSNSPDTASGHNPSDESLAAAQADRDDAQPEQAALRQVKKLTAEGKLAAAVEVCGNFIGTHPKSAEAFRLRAEANALRHNDADAVADFSTAILLEPQSAAHYVARGFFQLTHGNTSKSIDDFNAAIKLDPKNVDAYTDRGMAGMTAGELKPAIEDFNRAIEHDPKCVNAYTNRSFALIRLDRRRDALADLDRALQLDPKAAGAYDTRGSLRFEEHAYRDALADFTHAVELVRNNPTFLSHRRETYLKLERYAEAQADGSRIERLMQLAALNEAVFRDRLSPRPYLDRGDFLMEEGQTDDAIANFDHALQIDSKQWRGLIGRARAWLRKGEFQRAVADSTTAVSVDPRDEAYGVRGDAYRKLGQYAEAIADFDAAQRIDTDVADTWLAYSEQLRNAGRSKESDQALKKANELKSLAASPVRRVAATAASIPK